tara:strand:+ start:5143 stop:5511 length:369 start_codon:yes stop_codon:yes gene_type:complete
MFLSAKSFADLEGKALTCKWEGSITGYTFARNYKYRQYYVGQHNDTFRVEYSDLDNYSMNPDNINLYMGWKINRKTLRRVNRLGHDKGQCELADYETLSNRMQEHKNELQKKYNKKLERNKI